MIDDESEFPFSSVTAHWREAIKELRTTYDQLVGFDPLRTGWTQAERHQNWQSRTQALLKSCERLSSYVHDYLPPEPAYPVAEAALLLVCKERHSFRMLGTGVMLELGCAIASRETLAPVLADPTIELLAIQIVDRTNAVVWIGTKIEITDPTVTDAAFIHVSSSGAQALLQKWRRPKVRLSPPRAGEGVVICNWPNLSDSIEIADISRLSISQSRSTWAVVEYASEGLYRAGLQPSLLLRTLDATTAKDGPVFTAKGELCGLLVPRSRNIRPDEPGFLVASDLISAMSILVTFEREGAKTGMKYPAYHLFRYGELRAVDVAKFACDWDVATGQVRITRAAVAEGRVLG